MADGLVVGSALVRLVEEHGAKPDAPQRVAEFVKSLKEALTKGPEQPFLVDADSKLDYQKVIDVLETARSAGVRKISLVTQSSAARK